jgi:hypothetical protein
MSEPRPKAIPIAWVSKEDLFYARPDLAVQIEALDEADIENIAKLVEDAVQETEALALEIALLRYIGIKL